MKIGILQTGRSPDEIAGKYGQYDTLFRKLLAGRGFEFDTYAVLDDVLPDSVDAADGWLITGSKFGVYEPHSWIAPLESFLREAYAADIPIIGVCFGHQILAQALGGTVEKFDGGWSVGKVAYQTAKDEQATELMAFHQDQVTAIPDDAEVIGSTDFCQFAMLAYGNKALTVQPHPEFTADFMVDLLKARGDMLPDDIVEQANKNLAGDNANEQLADHFEHFFKTREIKL
ncbi:MAG: type 1 glutamine amidotransferase [Pseudomonadales bacterium]